MGGLFLSVALRVLAARALRLPAPGRFAVRVNHTLAIRPAISTQSQRLRARETQKTSGYVGEE
jgi:hypothetical protein